MQAPRSKLKVMFLCTGNSCRSQMAEGWARHLKSDLIEPYSAGIEKHGMNPHAIRIMGDSPVRRISARRAHVRRLKVCL